MLQNDTLTFHIAFRVPKLKQFKDENWVGGAWAKLARDMHFCLNVCLFVWYLYAHFVPKLNHIED